MIDLKIYYKLRDENCLGQQTSDRKPRKYRYWFVAVDSRLSRYSLLLPDHWILCEYLTLGFALAAFLSFDVTDDAVLASDASNMVYNKHIVSLDGNKKGHQTRTLCDDRLCHHGATCEIVGPHQTPQCVCRFNCDAIRSLVLDFDFVSVPCPRCYVQLCNWHARQTKALIVLSSSTYCASNQTSII